MIIHFTLDKISVDKTGQIKGKIEAKNGIKFLDIAESPTPEGITGQSLLKFKFSYKVDYLPDVAKTEIVGKIHFLTDKATKDKILEDWDKHSKIEPSLSGQLVNYVFSKCGVMALTLSQQVGLPPHISLPRIALKQKATESDEKDNKPKAS
ncbi:hypothetical protein HOM13_01115 [Candidatus Woesearchaeota archaeon]|jgi:hypothetical protein|nr:hypothetical protein [Candidatus Woesearchaeota archaeon]MBT5215314.1 hypothetical protein [Candidatus Woesearchaeota archaeon]MBT6048690.1 hypothetical protein [Candidatus Scalindua sp.]MBT6402132.1 hypothetical protein [Candidatus Woesearchaeota archaeon]